MLLGEFMGEKNTGERANKTEISKRIRKSSGKLCHPVWKGDWVSAPGTWSRTVGAQYDVSQP